MLHWKDWADASRGRQVGRVAAQVSPSDPRLLRPTPATGLLAPTSASTVPTARVSPAVAAGAV